MSTENMNGKSTFGNRYMSMDRKIVEMRNCTSFFSLSLFSRQLTREYRERETGMLAFGC